MAFPSSPTNGQIAVVNGIRYSYDSTVRSWTRLISSAKFTAAASAPSDPALGDEWYNTNLDILFQYVNDGTTSYWIDIQSLGQTGNITQIGSSTLEGNIVVGVTNRYSIGAANGYVANVFVNNLTANAITVSGNIVPSANVTYDLGSSNFRFKDLWLSGNTIYFGGANLTTSGGNVTINNPSGGSFTLPTTSGLPVIADSSTGAATIPVGTTAERPSSPVIGLIRINTTTGSPEWYNPANTSWQIFGIDEILKPTNSTPAAGTTDLYDDLTLTASTFYTAYNGITHSASQWQVSTAADFSSTVISTGDDAVNLTSYQLTSGILVVDTTYYWRVRYKNSRGAYSTWSAGTSFVTRASFRYAAAVTISANTTNYVLNTAKVAGYLAGKTDVTLTINPDVTVGSTSTSTYAFDVDTSWAAGDTVTIVNNGTVCGMGGTGGFGGASPSAGTAGGPGLRAQRAVSITNNNVVAGGGGGGGAAAACGPGCGYGGGGGGAGANVGGPGGSGGGGGCNITCDPGTATTGGAGYAGNGSFGRVANGYNGGSRGAAGTNGCTTAGGAGGVCANGVSNITWLVTGTRLGTLT